MTSVLLVAIGGYGENYLKELTQRDMNANIVGVCDIMPGLYEKYPILQKKNIPVYQDIETFYQNHQADLAVISTPIHCHTQGVLTCLANGSHVLCEKPLCITREEADRIAKAAEEAGRFVAIGYQTNYQRDIWQLKQDILSGIYGAPKRMKAVHAMRRGWNYYNRNRWAGHICANGCTVYDSPFNNACAHQFQLMTFLLGKDMCSAADIISAEGELFKANQKLENFDTAFLRFQTSRDVELCYYTSHALFSKKLGPFITYEFENGVITQMPGDTSFKGVLKDDKVIDYALIPVGNRLQKLDDALDHVNNGGAPICSLQAEYPHIDAVQLVQQLPISPVDAKLLHQVHECDDTFTCIEGLEEIFDTCANQYALPKELGITI